MIDRALTTPADAERCLLSHQGENILIDDFGMAPLPITASIALRKPTVHNVTLTPVGFSMLHTITID